MADGGQGGGGAGSASATDDATWIHTFFDTSIWASVGGDFAATASATTSVGGTGSYDWTGSALLADVQAWYDTPAGNFGWIVIGDELNTQSARRFDTREHATASRRPQLEITYEPETPIESASWGGIKTCSIE